MPALPPNIDSRTAADVAEQLQKLIRIYAAPSAASAAPAWNDVDPDTGKVKGVSAALIGVAARFSEIIIQRLNQVPQKNFLAFLDLLGASLLAPQPARVPLTFYLAKGSVVDGVVPAGTQVAAPPPPGEKDPVIYETQGELVVTAAEIASLVVRHPEDDTYARHKFAAESAATPIFEGNQQIDHILYLGHSQCLSSPAIKNLTLDVGLNSPASDALSLRWEIWDGVQWKDITPADPAKDSTKNLQQSGTIAFGAIPSVPATAVNDVSKEWIRCRLLTPITPAGAARAGMARASRLPQISQVRMDVHLHKEALRLETAFANLLPIDLSKNFFPFGEKPGFNDTLWMALEEAFSNASAKVTLNIELAEPGEPSSNRELKWEAWNGASFEPVQKLEDKTESLTKNGKVVFTLPERVASLNVNGKDSFWIRVRIGKGNYGVEGHFKQKASPQPSESPYDFVLPTFKPPSISSIKVEYDLQRERLVPEAVLTYNDSDWTDVTGINTSENQGFAPFTPSQDVRPTLYLGFVLPRGRTTFPNETLTLFFRGADLRYGQKTVPLAPDISRGGGEPSSAVTHRFFITNPGITAAQYTVNVLGTRWTPAPSIKSSTLTVPAGDSAEVDVQVAVPKGTSPGSSDRGFFQLISEEKKVYTSDFVTYCRQETPQIGANYVRLAGTARGQRPRLAWEYWDGQKWTGLPVRDETGNFTATGVVQFLPPPGFAARSEFGLRAWWLRVRWEEGDYDTRPRVGRILLNTTMAEQAVTIRNEILGSSDGGGNQTFQANRPPVLAGQSLQVREQEIPSGGELDAITKEEGADAVPAVTDGAGKASETWVRWHEVRDFYASDSRSRHYTLNHLSGQITFGDGLSGMVPPVGTGNLRLALYRTGGGVRGNTPAGSIVQLKTTLPYVDHVANPEPATGGAEAESTGSLLARAPTEIRHRGRAVTTEDYEDLAHLASPDVARALSVSNRNLVADPLGERSDALGNVSVIIVPHSADPKPQASFELLKSVQGFLAASSPVAVNVWVVGPFYIRVDVQVEIGLASLEGSGTVVQKVQNQLAAFLHPLTGGFDGAGWEFGREPHRSDLYSLIKQVPEVDHVRSLVVQEVEDAPGSRDTGRFLVYSGRHAISLVF